MTSEWTPTRLGEVTHQVQDSVKVAPGEEYPLLGVRWYAEGPFLREIVTAETSKATRFNRVQPGQFIYNRLFAWKGSFGLVNDNLAGCYVSNEFPLFVCDRSRLLPEFLKVHFQQRSVWSFVERASTGTTASRNRWKESQFNDYVVALPSVVAQRRIVDIVAAVDAQIEAVATEVDRLERTASVLGTVLLTPEPHWERTTIGDVAVTATGRAFPDRFQGEASGMLPYFKVSDMNLRGNQREMRVAPNWLTHETISEVKPRVCPAGTVLFPIIGAAMRTEKRRVLVQPSAFDQNIMGLIPRERVTTDFLFAVMSNLRLGELSQSGAVPSVNQKLVSAIQFALPPLEEQIAISGQLRATYAQAESLADELSRLRDFRSVLVSALLTQEIEIPDSYDRILEEVP
ncbi:EcoKI restriction-modification system protein HsdS [Microbacterium hydrocarbonoxydans]|uniref:EcoKI restriction-modification system protein HsdS n=1 Tax=Microbacterium hydrocarbonoxydans TaxID=273678 RepID=A0A0M2HHG2_9MICO|nr:restriction endonuclease subunit S [Microbacterium hydrocarbonoxydans]KJL46119.1 EcoKI restriction-modification system protein HsdS [Microbacterium hydrocarbonoxydans]